jgi:membrane-associated phospholipid phosphatase
MALLTLAPARAEEVPFTQVPSLWRETIGTVKTDVRDILHYPADHPKTFGKVALGIGILVVLDKPLTQFYQNTVERALHNFALPEAPWSWPEMGFVSEDFWLVSGIAGSIAYGELAGDARLSRAGALSAKALVYSYVTSQFALKTVFARKRPYSDLDNPKGDPDIFTSDPYDFFDWKGSFFSILRSSRSMPSYHFTEYFSVARVYSGVYDNSPVPYYLAGILAASNIKGHHHWVSDMVAGSAIGIGIGSLILKNDATWRAGQVQALPVIGPDTAGLSLSMRF